MGRFGCIHLFLSPKASLLCKFPCLLNLPPANLEWSASSLDLSLPSMYRSQFDFPWATPKLSNRQLASHPEDQRNRFWKRGNTREIPLAIDFYVERGGLYVRCWWTAVWVQGCLENARWSKVFVWGLAAEREMQGCAVIWPLLWAGWCSNQRQELGLQSWKKRWG